jgi:hypothetical protein
MKTLDLTALLAKTVLRLNRMGARVGSSIQLSLSRNLSRFAWYDRSLERLIEKLIHYASVINHPGRPVRIAVCRKARLLDLEKFFDIHPIHWVQLHIDLEAPGFERGARQIFEDHGYRCEEWVGVEDSPQQLGAFCIGAEQTPRLVFWAENRRFRHRCDLLIPVAEPLPS